ncbi:MAG TPA: protein kinase [Gemmatimonadales bacterium]|nr:protein kinase [Gemmatimonadales bacterium]
MRLGSYEISAQIGAGGMGEVYRATDTSLKRAVAIKVLPASVAADRERLARFQREAEVLASLNHPNIAAIYGLERSDGMTSLVMELVEGPTLSDRISQRPIPLDEALPIAKQIAEALEAAHEQSIIHRDLKPANIKVRPDGTVKVLDFGLAKVFEPLSAGSADATASPTIASPAMTGVGVLLGTAAYMSPEQAKGLSADKRSDVWAFGCVLFEMLTGRQAFEGDTTTEVLSGVLKSEPNWQLLPAHTPQELRRLLRRCLQKERRLRLHDIADARIDIDELQHEPRTSPDGIPSTPRRNARFVWFVATALLIVAGVSASVSLLRAPSSSPERRVEVTTPPTLDPVTLSISPDGEKVVFVATFEGRSLLWVRSLVSGSSQPLLGTDYAQYPFWSPNSRAIGFFAGGKLQRIDVDGGSVRPLANAQAGVGGTWNRDGTILFGTSTGRPISRISETGGMPVDVTKVEAPQTTHRFPQWLPDGRHFLYYVTGSPDVRGIHVGQLDGSPGQRLLDTDTLAVYAAGHLLFVHQGTLFAQAFDQERLQLTGERFRVAESVAFYARIAGELGLSASTTGSIAFRTASGAVQRRIEWFDRSGKQIGSLGDDIEGFSPALSPDGRRVALYRTTNGDQDIWWHELGREVGLRLTTDPSGDNSPLWSRDGSRVLFSTNRTGIRSIFEKSITGTGGETLFLQTDQNVVPLDWSPDGTLLYRSNDPKTNFDIWAMPAGDKKTFPVVRTSFDEREAQFSPDGKWIAYQSNQSGRFEIYVQPFPGPGTPLAISTNGGAQVRWRSDKELFYIALDGQLMAVPVRLSSDGTIDRGTPDSLFFTRIAGGPVQANDPHQYAVSRDGQRFLISTVTEVDNSPITVILNWKAVP